MSDPIELYLVRRAICEAKTTTGCCEWDERAEYNDRRHYYKAIVPAAGFPLGLFVEIVLSEEDPDLPGVLLVNVHEQQR
jgi:hypothetical protein